MVYDSDLLYKVAKLYYIDDLKQESIGRRLKLSRYCISRLLKRARDQGIVKVQVARSGTDFKEKK